MTQLAAPTIADRLAWRQANTRRAAATHVASPRHYQIGAVAVTVQSDLADIEREFHNLFAPYQIPVPPRDEFFIEVVTKRSPRTLRKYYHLYANGEEIFTVRRPNAILPHIEWAINCMVARYLPGYLQVHAAALSRDGVGAIFPGNPGQGKSTLTAGLLAAGWSYLSDEFALIDPETKWLIPYPKALCIKAGSFDTITSLGLPLELDRIYDKGEKGPVAPLNPLDIRPNVVSQPCPVGLIIFPQYGQGAAPSIEPISPAQAAFELSRLSFNLVKYRSRGIETLVDVARHARCYRLRTGDLDQSCELVLTCLQDFLDSES